MDQVSVVSFLENSYWNNIQVSDYLFMSTFEKRGHIIACRCQSVGLSISMYSRPSDVHSICFDPLARKMPNLVLWMPLESRWALLIFRSDDQRSRSNCWSLKKNLNHLLCWIQVITWWWCFPVISFISSMWASSLNVVNISCYMVSNSVPMKSE